MSTFRPPPKLTVSEWADEKRQLSSESSAEVGQWKTSRAEYQRGIMNAISDPLTEIVVFISCTQAGKTEIINNICGYFIDQDPAPILNVQPTLEIAKTWSKDRFAPMVRDTPCLNLKIADSKTRDSGNEILHKTFPGGHLTIAGANSPASLASRPIRILLCDEVDKYPASAGVEGDPIKLAIKRTATFWNRKIILISTPTIKNISRIEKAYEETDQRKFWVPCPECGEWQLLTFWQVRWPKTKSGRHITQDTYYVCEHCQDKLYDADIMWSVSNGEWEAQEEFKGAAGFWINELYSPWVTLSQMADSFIGAKHGGPEMLKVFYNTSLAESWDEGEKIDGSALNGRGEIYPSRVPMGGAVLTTGVDVQKNRIEVVTNAWGKDEECWNIDHRIFIGGPERPEVWQDLDNYLMTKFEHESGTILNISCCCVDSSAFTDEVYKYVKPRQIKRVFAIKGRAGAGMPLINKPALRRALKKELQPITVGTDTAKDSLFARFKITEQGPRYIHFPVDRDDDFFRQLTNEKKIPKHNTGFIYKAIGRNEVLDCFVYSMAALAILSCDLNGIAERLSKQNINVSEKSNVSKSKPKHRILHPGY